MRRAVAAALRAARRAVPEVKSWAAAGLIAYGSEQFLPGSGVLVIGLFLLVDLRWGR